MSRQRAARDTSIAVGAALAAMGLVVLGAAVLMDMFAVIRIGIAPTSYVVGKGLDVGHDLVLAAAFAMAIPAFLGRSEARERRLAVASLVAAAAFAVWIAAHALYGVNEPTPQGVYELVVIDALRALAATALVGTAMLAAKAFRRASSGSPGDQSERDGLLGWATVGLATSLGFLTAAASLDLDTVRFLGDGISGLRLSMIGLAVGTGGAVVATLAFGISRRRQRQGAPRWAGLRDSILAAALAVFFVGFALSGLGDGRVAHASGLDGVTPQLVATSRWVEATSAWILCVCAALVAVGFLVSSLSRPERTMERAI